MEAISASMYPICELSKCLNNPIQSLNLRGNNLKQAHLGDFLQAIKNNQKTLRLVNLDMSNN
jgi:hypothetical protein